MVFKLSICTFWDLCILWNMASWGHERKDTNIVALNFLSYNCKKSLNIHFSIFTVLDLLLFLLTGKNVGWDYDWVCCWDLRWVWQGFFLTITTIKAQSVFWAHAGSFFYDNFIYFFRYLPEFIITGHWLPELMSKLNESLLGVTQWILWAFSFMGRCRTLMET